MKKSTLIIIFTVFVASILFINFFGLNANIYNENVPVTNIQIKTPIDGYITGSENQQIAKILTEFTTIGSLNNGNPEGTFIFLEATAFPNNSSNSNLDYFYDEISNPNIEIYKINNGVFVFFKEETEVLFTIKSQDGRNIQKQVLLQAY